MIGIVERDGHRNDIHGERDDSVERVSTFESNGTERGERGREKDRGDGRDGSEGDSGQEKKDKKKDDESGSWDSTISLALNALAHAAS